MIDPELAARIAEAVDRNFDAQIETTKRFSAIPARAAPRARPRT